MFKKLFKPRSENISAAKIYSQCLKQSRIPAFYGDQATPDNYDGRVDLLTLHLTLVMAACQKFGENGRQLSQALYDVMVEDFDIALREEGIADSGIARRIKPIVGLFLERTKAYTEALLDKDMSASSLETAIAANLLVKSPDSPYSAPIAKYTQAAFDNINALSWDDLRRGKVVFPSFTGA